MAPPHDRSSSCLQVLFWPMYTSSVQTSWSWSLAKSQGHHNGGAREQAMPTEDQENRPKGRER